jgi:hypothetical protein
MSEPLKYILLIFLTIFMAAGVYIFQPISAGVEALTKISPCSQPLRYSIGSIDTRFAVSVPELEQAVEAAARTWNSGTGTALLSKQTDDLQPADIVIRLVYDGRQERTDREVRFRERIRSQQIRLDRQQIQHDKNRESFDEQSLRYKEFAENTAERLNELNEWIRRKNENGGFVGTDLEQFEQRKKDIEDAQDRVSNDQQELDKIARAINSEMDELNEKFADHNRLIQRYNDEFAGDLRFAKATYQKTSEGGIVTVNQFMNDKELTLIIAHELGHALGLTHLQQPESVMYSQMGEQQLNPTIQLTAADRQAVRLLCN